MDNQNRDAILQQAARHAARLWSGTQSAQDRLLLEAWLGKDQAHADAFSAAMLLSDGVVSLAQSDPTLQRMTAEAVASAAAPRASRFRNVWFSSALAASVALVAVLGLRSLLGNGTPTQEYASQGSPMQVALADGSRVDLDAWSRIQVRYEKRSRDIALMRGRALFDVTRDPARPFSVDAERVRVVALGTHFQVDRRDRMLAVTLTEGSVRVEGGEGQQDQATTLQPGERVVIATGTQTPWRRDHVDVDVATSWTRGRLLFRETPLEDALLELNQYSKTPIVLADPALSRLKVSGNFISSDTTTILAAFSAVLPLRTVERDGRILVLARDARTAPETR